jgi:hypothetical protein
MYSGTIQRDDLKLAEMQRHVPDVTAAELTIAGDPVLSLPAVRPWMSAFGSCLIGITAIRRNDAGEIEFQLADEHNKPYENGTVWRPASAFYDEWPQ